MSKARPSRFTFVGIDQEQPCTITTTSRSYLLHEAYMSLRLAICDENHLFSLKGSRHLYSGGDPLFVVHEEEDLCLTYASRIIISLLRNYVSDPFLLMQADPYPLPAYAYAPWCRAIFCIVPCFTWFLSSRCPTYACRWGPDSLLKVPSKTFVFSRSCFRPWKSFWGPISLPQDLRSPQGLDFLLEAPHIQGVVFLMQSAYHFEFSFILEVTPVFFEACWIWRS